jgi:pimeloyl-ACP methyl ester carboxylesterase
MTSLETLHGPIEVLTAGAGSDLFVLLHATAAGPKSLTGLAGALGGPNRYMVAPAMTGYGATRFVDQATSDDAPPNRILTNRAIATCVVGAFASDRRVVFGHSMGGAVALITALQAENDGRPLDAVVLYEPILPTLVDRSAPEVAKAAAWNDDLRRFLVRQVGAGNAEAGVRQFIEAWNETRWLALPETSRQSMIANAKIIATDVDSLDHLCLEPDELAACETPTLLLRGECSPEIAGHFVASAAAHLANAQPVTLPGCGHMAPMLAPRDVAAAIIPFLDHLGLA